MFRETLAQVKTISYILKECMIVRFKKSELNYSKNIA